MYAPHPLGFDPAESNGEVCNLPASHILQISIKSEKFTLKFQQLYLRVVTLLKYSCIFVLPKDAKQRSAIAKRRTLERDGGIGLNPIIALHLRPFVVADLNS